MTIRLVRILFPGAGLLVLSAWCLGRPQQPPAVLPELRGAGALEPGDHREPDGVRRGSGAVPTWPRSPPGARCWAACCSSACSCPTVARPARRASGRGSVRGSAQVREVLRNFGPVFVGRGVVQISAYVDTVLASLLPTGAVAGLSYAQVLYTLPVSLFGMSVSAAELPAMAGATGQRAPSGRPTSAAGSTAGLRQIAFFVVPSAMAFLALGDVVAGGAVPVGRVHPRHDACTSGAFSPARRSGCSRPPWAGSTPRRTTPCTTPARRCASPCCASRSPSGWATSSPCRCRGRWASTARWGAAGLTASAGMAGWIEFLLLRRALNGRIGRTGLPRGARRAALGRAPAWRPAAGWALRLALPVGASDPGGVVLLASYGAVYFFLTGGSASPRPGRSAPSPAAGTGDRRSALNCRHDP